MTKLTASDLTQSNHFVPHGNPRVEEPATYGTTTPEHLEETVKAFNDRSIANLVAMAKDAGIKTLYIETKNT